MLLFIVSGNVEPYVNVLAHAYKNLGIAGVDFVSIQGSTKSGSPAEFSQIERGILALLSELAQGKFHGVDLTHRDDGISTFLPVENALTSKSYNVINYSDLATHLHNLIPARRRGEYIVDVTGLTKNLAIEIVTLSLSLGLRAYSFELSQHRISLPAEMRMFHELKTDDYSYVCLTDTPAIRAASTRLVRRDRVLAWTLAATITTLGSFLILTFTDDQNIALKIVGLAANIIGIAGPTLQLASRRNP
jgi:hypothetical protein